MSFQVFETERLILKPTLEEDAELILALLNTPKFIKYVGDRNVRTVDEAKAYIKKKMIPQLERLGFGNFTLIEKSKNAKIGTCGLYDREGMEGFDIGFALLPDYEGLGFGFESANKLIQVAFEEFKINEISGITTKDNIASQKLLEKLGLELKGTINLPDDDEELLLYVLKM